MFDVGKITRAHHGVPTNVGCPWLFIRYIANYHPEL